MVVYSHSRVSCFENCPYCYKLKYIDRVKPEFVNTVEAFMGGVVHEALEWLYKMRGFCKEVSLDDLVRFYLETWEKKWSEDILIVKARLGLTAENYKDMGVKFLVDYFSRMPLNEMRILGLETEDKMSLSDGNLWHVRIDKLGCDGEGNYFVCDYKTNSRMKMQEEADEDRQLAMYSIWVRERFPDCRSVKLVWHMLAFDRDVVSERSVEELVEVEREVVERIREIEGASEFPRRESALCDYCGYKGICPSFRHCVGLSEKDEGKMLVDEFAGVSGEIKELKVKEDRLRGEIVEFARAKGVDVVYGSEKRCSVKDYGKVVLPEDRGELIRVLKGKGLWDEFAMINYSRFNAVGRRGELDEEVGRLVEIGEDWRVSLGRRKDLG